MVQTTMDVIKDQLKEPIQIYRFVVRPARANDPRSAAYLADAHTLWVERYAKGIAWGEMKQYLFEYLNDHLKGPRARYLELLDHPEQIESVLQEGARKARAYSKPFLAQIRHTVGIATLG